jgi:F-type H+-transporting ATPase subunit b
MITPDWTIIASAVIFLFTLWALNRFLFRPLFRVTDERNARTTETQREANQKQEQRDALFREYSEKLRAEKQSGYKLVERIRQDALEKRQEMVVEAREKGRTALANAKDQIEEEVQAVKKSLRGDAEEMARLITAQVLGKS